MANDANWAATWEGLVATSSNECGALRRITIDVEVLGEEYPALASAQRKYVNIVDPFFEVVGVISTL